MRRVDPEAHRQHVGLQLLQLAAGAGEGNAAECGAVLNRLAGRQLRQTQSALAVTAAGAEQCAGSAAIAAVLLLLRQHLEAQEVRPEG